VEEEEEEELLEGFACACKMVWPRLSAASPINPIPMTTPRIRKITSSMLQECAQGQVNCTIWRVAANASKDTRRKTQTIAG
jgi:hypothetical protein